MNTTRDVILGPHQMSLDITNNCNLRCLHCYNESGCNHILDDELSDAEILMFIDSIKYLKLFNFCFCGGETLLRKELIIKASKKLKENGVVNVSMVTNGILLDEKTFLELREAGVNKIQVSVDGATAESHDRLRNKKGAFDSTMNAIKMMVSHGFQPQIAFTPTSFNINEIEDLQSQLREMGVVKERLRTQPLMLLGRANDNIDNIVPTQEQYREFVSKVYQLNYAKQYPEIDWGDPVDHLLRFLTNKLVINSCIIRSNGDLSPDPYLPIVVGNIKKHKFSEYWNAGFSDIWSNNLVTAIASNIKSINDMGKKFDNVPIVWKESDIVLDLIDGEL